MSEFVEEEDSDKIRAGIVERYRRGPDGPIEPWEDASFIIYSVTDRYGFLHKHPLPQYERDEKLLELERERAKKWIKMLANWKTYHYGDKFSEKLKRRIFKGIPDSLRGEAWKKILNIDSVMKKGVYDKFRLIALENSPDIRQIDLDVNRTYRDHIMFRERFCVKQQALFHVLAAYSMFNTEVGYCQGMSGIAALLLMYMNEEDAFWALSELLVDRKHAMHGLFIPGFPKLLRFQTHHDKILSKLIPKMSKHLEKEGVHTSLYTLKWFMQCFLDRLPFSLVLRIYDIYMLEGDRIIIAMAFHILKMFKKQILKMDLEGIAPLLQEEIPNHPFNDDEIVEGLQETMNELRKSKLDQPPPATNSELPSKPPGTLPDRNSFITASKRARMSRDRTNTLEVPIGRPPSPDEPVQGIHRRGSRASHKNPDSRRGSEHPSSQAGSPTSSLNYKGLTFQQPRPDIIPSPKNSPPYSAAQHLPSYSEFIEHKMYSTEDITSRNSAGTDRRRSKDKGAHKTSSESKFYTHSSPEDVVDSFETQNPGYASIKSGTDSFRGQSKTRNIDVNTERVHSQQQSWSTEIHSSYRNESSESQIEHRLNNGYVRPETPPRDYQFSPETDKRAPYRKDTTYRVNPVAESEEFRVRHNSDYATETML